MKRIVENGEFGLHIFFQLVKLFSEIRYARLMIGNMGDLNALWGSNVNLKIFPEIFELFVYI
jgi:hypothetical protein